ncbi:hydroxymethylbilane synthase [Rubinisphaera sp. JC750]|uniref:hydroxymethylbilane synthase n=1 Tax=Rubinisphaera sp. JC750 TaxID=2898658 RepID=UPI001F02F782|nr:hydroxymethylbilane synthase [Rubinisphaera sp. JC750]
MTDTVSTVRIATRSSELALWQATHVAALLRAEHPDINVELVDVSTQGDADQRAPLWSMGGTGVFTKEVQRTVLDGMADLAVHSLKDLPTEIVDPDLTLAAVPEREQRWDALVLRNDLKGEIDPADPLASLQDGARIGSGSLRRRAQLRAQRPDLKLLEIRGNLNTRLRKLDEGEYDAIILATAGLLRLGWNERLSCRLQPPVMFPAVGQGALGLECRTEDEQTRNLLESLNDPEARLATHAERRLLNSLRAGCHAPVGVNCERAEGRFTLSSVVLSPDGAHQVDAEDSVDLGDDWANWQEKLSEVGKLGEKVAKVLLERGAQELIERAG